VTVPAEAAAAAGTAASGALLDVQDLRTYFKVMDGIVRAVDGVSFSVGPGQTLGVVGESGCGKSVTALSIMRLHETPPTWIPTDKNAAQIPEDVRALLGDVPPSRIFFEGRDLLGVDDDGMRHIRGNDIAMIFQEPMTSLNPVFTIGNQISEAILLHQDVNEKEARNRAIESLRLVGVSAPERRVKQYPHELSGGMRQRAMIAMALSCNPKLLIADEPTTALDVTIQAQILELIKDLQQRLGTALLLITHDLAVVAETVETIAVMYAGRIVETGTVNEVLLRPQHPYTEGLLSSIPAVQKRGRALSVIKGVVPNPFRMPPGCKFAPRCPWAWDRCSEGEPELLETATGARSRCFLHAPEGASRRLDFERAVGSTVEGMVAASE
jgi:oligopeptide/dipeptide ABC transporter ATP-binding protein